MRCVFVLKYTSWNTEKLMLPQFPDMFDTVRSTYVWGLRQDHWITESQNHRGWKAPPEISGTAVANSKVLHMQMKNWTRLNSKLCIHYSTLNQKASNLFLLVSAGTGRTWSYCFPFDNQYKLSLWKLFCTK